MLAAAFGDPLEECKYIDEAAESPNPTEGCLDGETEEDTFAVNRVFIRNKFWYCVAINQFHWIIDAYNDTMGDSAWRGLCRHMDAVQNDINCMGIVSEAGLEHQRQAEQMILEFARKYAVDQESTK